MLLQFKQCRCDCHSNRSTYSGLILLAMPIAPDNHARIFIVKCYQLICVSRVCASVCHTFNARTTFISHWFSVFTSYTHTSTCLACELDESVECLMRVRVYDLMVIAWFSHFRQHTQSVLKHKPRGVCVPFACAHGCRIDCSSIHITTHITWSCKSFISYIQCVIASISSND